MKLSIIVSALFCVAGLAACNPSLSTENQSNGSFNGVINGTDVVRQTPASRSVVLLEMLDFRGRVVSMCTGTLISEKYVLTAAHCFDSNVVVGFARANIVFDTNYDFKRLGKSAAKFSVRGGTPIMHPRYHSEGQYDHDAAVISFRGGIPEGFMATQIDNDKYANYGDRKVVAYGFGRLSDYTGVVGEDIYQKIGILRRGDMVVDSLYNQFADRYYTSLSTRAQLCNGDSGGPQFLEKNGVAVQIGINSAVEGPTLANGMRSCKGPSHVTKVAFMYDWIMKQIR